MIIKIVNKLNHACVLVLTTGVAVTVQNRGTQFELLGFVNVFNLMDHGKLELGRFICPIVCVLVGFHLESVLGGKLIG